MDLTLIVGNEDGGLVHYTAQLANALTPEHTVTVIGPQDLNISHFSNDIRTKTINSGPIFGRIQSDSMHLSRLIRCIEHQSPDVVHVLSSDIDITLSLLKLRSVPLVVTVHNPMPLSPGKARQYPLLISDELSKQINILLGDQFIVHGEKLKNQLSRRGVSIDDISVIPHGDYSFFTQYESDSSNNIPVVLFFGYIAPHKGLDILLKAESQIANCSPNAKIIIAGKGDLDRYSNLIDDSSRYEIRNEYIPDEDVSDLFSRADVVVLPYRRASQSGVIPVAYAFSTPIVATEVGSLPEVVKNGKTGFLVPPQDSDALGDAICRLLRHPERRAEMGKNAYDFMESELSWDRIAEQTVSVYQRSIK